MLIAGRGFVEKRHFFGYLFFCRYFIRDAPPFPGNEVIIKDNLVRKNGGTTILFIPR